MIWITLIALIPQLFSLTVDLTKLFDGTATKEEWSKVLADLEGVVDNTPELKAVFTLLEPLIKIAEFSLPIITETMKTNSLMDSEVKPVDVVSAKASLRILKHLSEHVTDQAKNVQYSGGDLQSVYSAENAR